MCGYPAIFINCIKCSDLFFPLFFIGKRDLNKKIKYVFEPNETVVNMCLNTNTNWNKSLHIKTVEISEYLFKHRNMLNLYTIHPESSMGCKTSSVYERYMLIDNTYQNEKHERPVCLFVCLFPLEKCSFMLRCHHYRWRAANFGLCLALIAVS